MGDMGDDFAAMRAHTKAKHQDWKRKNMEILNASGAIFTVTNSGETLLFRMTGFPKADFYPSTGRWRVAGKTQTFRGGAESFLSWYRKQGANSQKEAKQQ